MDAAGYTGGGVSPGEIVVIFGSGIGPPELVALEVLGGRLTTELAGVRVLFDGVPAPLVYVFETQVSAIVPYAMAGAQSTDLVVEYASEMSSTVTLPVENTVPGVFTLDASGSGQGAILNQDGSLNSETNPADLGDIIVLYATGEGQTIPPGQDGLIAVSEELPAPELEVTARLGGEEADIIYAGAAPFLVAGVMQVNARLATTIRSDLGAEVRLRVDGIRNQEGVTFAVVSQADILPPGKTVKLYGAASFLNPDFAGGVDRDRLLAFEIRDALNEVVLAGNVQDRVVASNNTGLLTFAPLIRDVDDFGSGAKITALEKTGFAGAEVHVEYRTDGLGTIGPARAVRSSDGTTIVLEYDPPLALPESSLFPWIVTDAASWEETGQITIRVVMPDETTLSTTLDEGAAPQ